MKAKTVPGAPTRHFGMSTVLASSLLVAVVTCISQDKQRPSLPARTSPALVLVPLPGSPFQALPTEDGRWIFASITAPDRGKPGIALLARTDEGASLVRFVELDSAPTGMIVTHDGALLVVAAQQRIAFLDVARLVSNGEGALLGYLMEGSPTRLDRIYVNVTRDDHFLFASDESAKTITVIDLPKARASGFDATSIVGKIPVGNSPIDLAFSNDDRYLYATSQTAQPSLAWPIVCRSPAKPEAGWVHPEGTISIIDVERARTDPAHSVLATVAAGCNPVRLVLSPTNDVAYVSARGMDALLAFDTKKLVDDPAHAKIGEVPVGKAPVGVAVFDSGKRVLVTSSNRFEGTAQDHQSVFVVDAARVSEGAAAVLGTIPAGAFPREMRVSADGATLFLTNFASKTLEIVDLQRLPLVRDGS